jgi:hypothetical protein
VAPPETGQEAKVMEPQLTALADSANFSQEGKMNILGAFDVLFAEGTPVMHPVIWFVARLQIGVNDFGQHQVLLRVVTEDGDTVLSPLTLNVDLPKPSVYSGDPVFLPLMLQVQNAQFPEYGTYTFELWVDDAMVASAPLFIRQPPMQPGVSDS